MATDDVKVATSQRLDRIVVEPTPSRSSVPTS
jgi:hypothetical protein